MNYPARVSLGHYPTPIDPEHPLLAHGRHGGAVGIRGRVV